MTETNARMIAAQIAVHENSSMVRWLDRALVIWSRSALTSTANRPNVIRISGSVNRRMIVPRIALTMPKSAETQMYPQTPPETSMPERSQLVMPNATASRAQPMRKRTNTYEGRYNRRRIYASTDGSIPYPADEVGRAIGGRRETFAKRGSGRSMVSRFLRRPGGPLERAFDPFEALGDAIEALVNPFLRFALQAAPGALDEDGRNRGRHNREKADAADHDDGRDRASDWSRRRDVAVAHRRHRLDRPPEAE